MTLHWDVLDKKRQSLLPYLRAWKDDGFYLAGGTALALQIGHRTSLDFDFYRDRDFDPMEQARKLKLPSGKLKMTMQKSGTLLAVANGTQISAFYYPYRLLKPLIDASSLALSSLEDIAAMKVVAVAQRGRKRDFIDLYFLCRQWPLTTILQLTQKKYPMFDVYTGLRGLVYFEEADREKPRLGVQLRDRVDWNTVKVFFRKAVQKAT